jgi:mono/diheme cytochrome c family protein
MRRPTLVLLGATLVVGLLAVLVARAVEETRPPPGASLGERVYYRYCVDCHGRDGRGSWRARIFLMRPGDLSDRSRLAQHSDRYLFDLVKQGGSPVGRPGMPGFAFNLTDEQIEAVVAHLRTLSR